eukprot:6477669-Amphidinium_carterae.1
MQEVPYPAYKWLWELQPGFVVKTKQHINLLEMFAILQCFRSRIRSPKWFHKRHLHVVDSQVCQGVLAKGRSSSVRLNSIMRRLAAMCLCSDSYIVCLWTISGWNPADSPSRAHA